MSWDEEFACRPGVRSPVNRSDLESGVCFTRLLSGELDEVHFKRRRQKLVGVAGRPQESGRESAGGRRSRPESRWESTGVGWESTGCRVGVEGSIGSQEILAMF